MKRMALLVAAVLRAAPGPATPPPRQTESGEATSCGAAAAGMPFSEAAVCATLDEFAARDRAAGMSEMRLANLRVERAKALEKSIPGGSFADWVGTVEDVHTGFRGKAVLRVKLPCRGSLATWDSFVSDLFDKTQIPHNSELFAEVARLKAGSLITVSGTFLASREDGFREASATERTSMAHPKFIVHFRSVKERSSL